MPRKHLRHPEERPEGMRLEGRSAPIQPVMGISVEVSVHCDAWHVACPDAAVLAEVAARTTLSRAAAPLAGAPVILGLILTDDAEQRRAEPHLSRHRRPDECVVLRDRRSAGRATDGRAGAARRCRARAGDDRTRSEGAAEAAGRPSAPTSSFMACFTCSGSTIRPGQRPPPWRPARSRYCRFWGCRILIAILCEQADPDTLHR